MNRNFKTAHGMATGQVTHSISGQEQDHAGLARCLAQLLEGVALILRQPVFQEINVVWHLFFLLPPSLPAYKYMMMLILGESLEEVTNQYITITYAEWLDEMTQIG